MAIWPGDKPPDQIDMMEENELRDELRSVLLKLKEWRDVARQKQEIIDAEHQQTEHQRQRAVDAESRLLHAEADFAAAHDAHIAELDKRKALEARLDECRESCARAVAARDVAEALVAQNPLYSMLMERIDPLAKADPAPDSADGVRLVALAELCEAYEKRVVETSAPIASEKLRGDDGIIRLAFARFDEGYVKWKCPTSPTGCCEYDAAKDPAWDQCLHCGDPCERK